MRLGWASLGLAAAATLCLPSLMLSSQVPNSWPPHHPPATANQHIHSNQILLPQGRHRRQLEESGPQQQDTLDDRGNSSAQLEVLELSVLQAAQHGFFRHSPSISVIITIAYTLVFVIGLVGNSFVVAIVCKSPRMRTVTNYFIANLALADILVLLFCLPATLMSNLFYPYVLGLFVCKTVSYLQGVVVSASIHTMLAVTIDRFLAICFPMDWHMSRRMARWTIACIWIFSLSISFPWFLYFTLVPFGLDNYTIQVCSEEWPSEQWGTVYFVCANLILLYLFPLTVIIICYLGIWYKIERRNIPGDRPQGLKIELIMQKSKLKVVKMMMVVVVVFLLSWFPLYLITARLKLSEGGTQWEDWLIPKLMPLAQWLGASNSCINPILYTLFNRKYQHGFMELLRYGCCCWCGRTRRRRDSRALLNNNNKQQQLVCGEPHHQPMMASSSKGNGSGTGGSGCSIGGCWMRRHQAAPNGTNTNTTSTTSGMKLESLHNCTRQPQGGEQYREMHRSMLASSHEQLASSSSTRPGPTKLSAGARCRSVVTLNLGPERSTTTLGSYRASLSTLNPMAEQVGSDCGADSCPTKADANSASGDGAGAQHKSAHRKQVPLIVEAQPGGRRYPNNKPGQQIGQAANKLDEAPAGEPINLKLATRQNGAKSTLHTSAAGRAPIELDNGHESALAARIPDSGSKRRPKWRRFNGAKSQSKKSNSPSVTRDTESTDVAGWSGASACFVSATESS